MAKKNSAPVSNKQIDTKIKRAETRVFKVVFPDTTNHHNTMFGGRIMLMMTETAFMTATRFSRKSFVIVSSDRIDFKKPIPAATLVELIGTVHKLGNTSITIKVEIFLEKMDSDFREKVVSGLFTLVALDKKDRPTPIL
ncbi:MAG TPA: hotdog domain-containing protein [Bacteroidia bacterium]|jgi:acyl-CoA hydrolase|nr:hotdog domain-containing protein [Bacteroidia bacterium]